MHTSSIGRAQTRTQIVRISHAVQNQQQGGLGLVFKQIKHLVHIGGNFAGLCKGHHALMRSEEHTSELQSLMRISYAVFCLKKKNTNKITSDQPVTQQDRTTRTSAHYSTHHPSTWRQRRITNNFQSNTN